MRFDAVIFDLDGTLLDTLGDIAAAMNAVLAAHGHPAHPAAAYKHMIGDGVGMLVRRALPEGAREQARIAALETEMRETYGRAYAVRTRPYEGIPDMLDALAARGLALAVLSNKPDALTRACVEALLPRWRFAAVVGEKAGVPPKPDPAGARAIVAAVAAAPERVLYVGDSGVDMETAVAAGLFPAGALWGFRSRAELERGGARVLLARPADVLPLVDTGPRPR
ncbi:MAG: HAD family hydrolase [Candidatus Krumholzibacteria bacterium]|nr:HAD family hydrolase [Candidatus Krumholzibacteria bacterium]